MRHLAVFLAGALFGIGLAISGMTQPQKVIGFLDFAGRWDPALMFVMVGAIGVNLVLLRLTLRRPAPVHAPTFQIPTRTEAMAGPSWPGRRSSASGASPASVRGPPSPRWPPGPPRCSPSWRRWPSACASSTPWPPPAKPSRWRTPETTESQNQLTRLSYTCVNAWVFIFQQRSTP